MTEIYLFSPNAENTDQKNSEYEHFLRSVCRKNKYFTKQLFIYKFNPVMPGVDKSSCLNLQILVVSLFKYV